MANPTTNFNWQMPTNTDLVKDLPADFEVFGQAVDTSLMDLKGGTTGQILSKASNSDMDFTWIANDQGDITAVTAGTGISGGGTSGAVTITNSMATAIDAKGDLVAGTGADTFARLAAGNDGETLVADSSATTGLRWQGDYAAGKNKIINGDLGIWQRGTSFSYTGSGATIYTADRFAQYVNGDGTYTFSRQSFTPGTAPVSGYEGSFFTRFAVNTVGTSTVGVLNNQKIEDVRTFAGQTVTLSFWAKVNSGTPTLTLKMSQVFGSGGSATVSATDVTVTLSTTWTRYSGTFALPSISGKTIGTNSNLDVHVRIAPTASLELDMWGVQLESGSVATAFQTATGTLAGELAACQRYYYRTATGSGRYGVGFTKTTTTAEIVTAFPVTMRTSPSALEQTGTAGDFTIVHQNTSTALSIVPAFNNANVNMASTNLTVASGLTAGNGCALSAATGNSYLGWSAEL